MFRKLWSKTSASEASEAKLVEKLIVYPYFVTPGLLEPYERKDLLLFVKMAKRNLAKFKVTDMYEEGVGDSFIYNLLGSSRYERPPNYEFLLERAQELKNYHGIEYGSFKLWLDWSPLEREVRFIQSQVPIMGEVQQWFDRGWSRPDISRRLASGAFPFLWYDKNVGAMGRTDVDSPLPIEAMAIVLELLATLGSAGDKQSTNLFVQECQSYSSANAWIRHRILKTINEDDIERDHPGTYIRFEG